MQSSLMQHFLLVLLLIIQFAAAGNILAEKGATSVKKGPLGTAHTFNDDLHPPNTVFGVLIIDDVNACEVPDDIDARHLYKMLDPEFQSCEGIEVTLDKCPKTDYGFEIGISMIDLDEKLLENDFEGLKKIITNAISCSNGAMRLKDFHKVFSEIHIERIPPIDFGFTNQDVEENVGAVQASLRIPFSKSYINDIGPPRNQGDVGACAAFCMAAIFEYYEQRDHGDSVLFSPKFFYYNRDGAPESGPGMIASSLGRTTKDHGCVPEFMFPFTGAKDTDGPDSIPSDLEKKGEAWGKENYGNDEWECVSAVSLDVKRDQFKHVIKVSLAMYGVLNIGTSVHDTGFCDIWNSYGSPVDGGHAMAVVAYNDMGITIRNSWSTDWCDNGHMFMSWDDAYDKALNFCYFKKPISGSLSNADRRNALVDAPTSEEIANIEHATKRYDCDWVENYFNWAGEKQMFNGSKFQFTRDECITIVMEKCPEGTIANYWPSDKSCRCQFGHNMTPAPNTYSWNCLLSDIKVDNHGAECFHRGSCHGEEVCDFCGQHRNSPRGPLHDQYCCNPTHIYASDHPCYGAKFEWNTLYHQCVVTNYIDCAGTRNGNALIDSCGICNGNNDCDYCTDSDPHCEIWASDGECDLNRDYMSSNCRLSCGFCTPTIQCNMGEWPDIKKNTICGNCKALIINMRKRSTYETCHNYCANIGLKCKTAGEEKSNTCTYKREYNCDFNFATELRTNDAICECYPPDDCPCPQWQDGVGSCMDECPGDCAVDTKIVGSSTCSVCLCAAPANTCPCPVWQDGSGGCMDECPGDCAVDTTIVGSNTCSVCLCAEPAECVEGEEDNSDPCQPKTCLNGAWAVRDVNCPDPESCASGLWEPAKEGKCCLTCILDGDCTDATPDCESWAADGECDANPEYMLSNCQLSCGVCTPNGDCTDATPDCENWAAHGECDANPGYMLSNCQLSCGVCTPRQEATCDCSCHHGDYVPDERNSPVNDCWIKDIGYDKPCCDTNKATAIGDNATESNNGSRVFRVLIFALVAFMLFYIGDFLGRRYAKFQSGYVPILKKQNGYTSTMQDKFNV